MSLPLKTDRLTLRSWRVDDRAAFAALNADPEVMSDLGGPLNRRASDAKLDRYRATFEEDGFSRLAIEDEDGTFVGYAGVMPAAYDHPLAPHYEIEITRPNRLDEITIVVEARADFAETAHQGEARMLAAKLKDNIGISADVRVAVSGSLPRSAGKASHVKDRR